MLTPARFVRVVHNGQLIHEDADVTTPTPMTSPGPLLLQGGFGGIAFRNVRVRPIMPVAHLPPEEEKAEAAPPGKKADYDAIATGKWIPVLRGETDLRDKWVVLPEHRAGDVIIRARVKKVSGQNLGLFLRSDEKAPVKWGYAAWFNGGNWFGIMKWSEGQQVDLRQWRAPTNFDDYFEFAFSAVGEMLTIYADGKRIGEVRDPDYRPGFLAIKAMRGRSLFQTSRS